jgi:hypothetical protein
LLDAFGADLRRWPADERAAAEAFATQHAGEMAVSLAAARALDGVLEDARAAEPPSPALTSRILMAAPRARARTQGFDRRAGWALAACALLGVMLGFSGGLLAPVAGADDAYFSVAFEAPSASLPGDEG